MWHLETVQIRPCREPFEHGPCCRDLEPRRFLVAEQSTGVADEHSRPRRLVRRVQLFPYPERAAQRFKGGVRVGFSDGNRAVGVHRYGAQHVGGERVCQLLQLIAGASRCAEITTGQHDLDVRRQDSRTLNPIAGAAGQPTEGCARRVCSSLRETQQRESGLRLESELAGRAIRGFRLRQPTKRLMDNNALSGYAIVKVVAEAAKRAKSADPKAVAAAIRAGRFDIDGYAWPLSYTEWGEMKEAAPILYTYEKGAAGAMNPDASWRPKVVFRSKTTPPYVPGE